MIAQAILAGERIVGRVAAMIERTGRRWLTQLVRPPRLTALMSVVMRPAIEPAAEPSPRRQARRDRWRQALNLILAIGQFAAAALIFSGIFGDELFYQDKAGQPLIVPSDGTFAIWGVIFPGSIAYGIYQALPGQRANPLLRRIGFHTAFAFGCITLWSAVTPLDPILLTVPLFFGALYALITAIYRISRQPRRLTWAERGLVLAPLSIFAAWCTVGTIANTSTSLFALGFTSGLLGLSAQTWTIILLAAAAWIGGFVIRATGGNLAYALTIIWALSGIVAVNRSVHANGLVAAVAGGAAIAVAGVQLGAMWRSRSSSDSATRG